MIPGEARLKQARDTFRYNYGVAAHNKFADLFNRGKYDEAKAALDEALANVPDNKALQNDQTILRRQTVK
jgi:tetratricopeptide (TPR) repeat protein